MANQRKRLINYCLIAACALIPWNATAINHAGAFGHQQLLGDSLASRLDALESGSKLGLNGDNATENMLVKSLFEISQGKTKQALETIDQLISTTPNFKLAYLIRGDLLMAQSKPLEGFGDVSAESSTDNLAGLRDEARARIEHFLTPQNANQFPNLLIQANDNQRYVIVVDALKSRLYLYKNNSGKLSYVTDYYATIGKNGAGKGSAGDKRTPIGVYFASTQLKSALPDYYGDAAYPLNYPNELDQHTNKSGSGIWLHGTSQSTYSRPPRASDGCVVLSNPDLKALQPILQSGNTPVIIVNNLSLSDKDNAYAEQKNELTEVLDSWRKDWIAQDTSQYLSHYSKNFFSSGGNYQKWADYKTLVQASKPLVDVTVSNVSMFSYPSASQKLVVVEFDQDFKANALENKMRKRQYWVFENNTWKIIYEGKA